MSNYSCFNIQKLKLLMLYASLSLLSHAVFGNDAGGEFAKSIKPWDEPHWIQCVSDFKKSAKHGRHPEVRQMINGVCQEERRSKLPSEICFMEVVGPSDIFSANDFEYRYKCVKKSGTVLMVCTNKKNHYMEAMTSRMRNDPRCDGFPDLLSIDMRIKGPNQVVNEIASGRQSNTPECVKQVARIQKLENDPSFDNDRKIRLQWSEAVDVGMRMKCHF